MLKVVITVDTELWPSTPEWPDRMMPRPYANIERDYDRCILGQTKSGSYGLPYLLEILERHDLRAVFFVESLCASVLGVPHVAKTVKMIQEKQQEVQLHVHTEWLSEAGAQTLPHTHRQNLGDFGLADQISIVRQARENLLAAGAAKLVALRAGNMGGNRDTPYAAFASGLSLDMSFDLSRNSETRDIVAEINRLEDGSSACPIAPLSCVEDYPRHYRPAQLTALSFAELRSAMILAERNECPYFVLLLHSFELIDRKDDRPHKINISRFNRLCEFLDNNRDRFVTVGCEEISSRETAVAANRIPRTSALGMIWRVGEQLLSRAL